MGSYVYSWKLRLYLSPASTQTDKDPEVAMTSFISFTIVASGPLSINFLSVTLATPCAGLYLHAPVWPENEHFL